MRAASSCALSVVNGSNKIVVTNASSSMIHGNWVERLSAFVMFLSFFPVPIDVGREVAGEPHESRCVDTTLCDVLRVRG